MREELSGKQQQIFEFLRTFLEDKDYPPSIRDIQEGCGISSTSVVDYNLRKLEEKGYIRRDREVSRGIEILGARRNRARIIEIPVLGTIAAGQPIPVPTSDRFGNDADDTVAVTEDMIRGRPNVFALRVKGTSNARWMMSRRVSMSDHTSWRLRGSRPVVGSSRNTTLGQVTRPHAMSIRRRIPPE